MSVIQIWREDAGKINLRIGAFHVRLAHMQIVNIR